MRLSQEGIHAHLFHKGDPTAGAVTVKLAFMNGKASFYTRGYGLSGKLEWITLCDAEPEFEVDETIRRQISRDRDVWVIEVEDPRGRSMLDVLDAMEDGHGLAG